MDTESAEERYELEPVDHLRAETIFDARCRGGDEPATIGHTLPGKRLPRLKCWSPFWIPSTTESYHPTNRWQVSSRLALAQSRH